MNILNNKYRTAYNHKIERIITILFTHSKNVEIYIALVVAGVIKFIPRKLMTWEFIDYVLKHRVGRRYTMAI